MLKSLSRAALLLAVVTTMSCRDVLLPEWEIRVAQGQWVKRGSDSYRITVTRLCFCPQEITGPVIVEVTDGVITSLRYEATGAPVPQNFARFFPTVDGLFAIVLDARRNDYDYLAVRFHPTYGFPTSIATDGARNIADDEHTWKARDLVLR